MQTMSFFPTVKSTEFEELLEPFGQNATQFFLAASLYHAHKVSFAKASELAGLSFDEFNYRLKEHFGVGYIFDDSVILEDLELLKNL
jgi:predicted HTH domain antitoxin